MMLLHSFWAVRDGVIVYRWNFDNYAMLFKNPLYLRCSSAPRASPLPLRCSPFFSVIQSRISCLSTRVRARKFCINSLLFRFGSATWFAATLGKQFLGSDGVLNGFLQYLHITHGPVSAILYSPFAVVLMLTHIYTPFVFLPIYASLEHIPRPLVEASQDLGASPRKTFFRVILPLSLPGLLAGATFAFVLSLGDFLAPLLVGGPSGTMIANLVQSLFGAAYDWPLGAAISVSILVITVALLAVTQRVEKHWSFE